jgi:hypothetical protein
VLEFRAHREPGQTFPDRYSYLHSKTGEVAFNARICHALAHVNEPLTAPPGGGEADVAHEPSRGFPWMTLVLGSGCYEPRDRSIRELLDGLPEGVSDALSEHGRLSDDTEPSVVAAGFTTSLIKDRLGIETIPGTAATRPVPRHAAELVYVTALLTRFFHQVKALGVEAPNRWSDDVATLGAAFQEADEIAVATVAPSRAILARLLADFPDDNADDRVSAAIHRLLLQIRNDLDTSEEHRPALHAVHLRVLAECAWHVLTLGTPVYPGWSDLLVDLSLYGRLLPATNVGRPRPLFDSLADAPTLIAERYDNPTRAAWEALQASDEGDEETMHDRAAAVLLHQARLRTATLPAERPPVAAAFVTTFDLELEMALWANGSGQPFIIALPVYVYRGEVGALHRTAALCWLGARIEPDHRIDPDEQLRRLREPSSWTVLSDHKHYDRTFGDLPVVVRLSGCPSIRLPLLGTENSELNIAAFYAIGPEAARPADAIGHAVLLDEYAALHHASAENAGMHHPESKLERRYGLPQEITGVTTNARSFARFWTIMGVQMGDSGVRFRVASQIGTPTGAFAAADSARRPRRAGVVINQRLDVTEQDLLYWFGFDIVIDRCQSFGDDLDHYVRHLVRPQHRTRPRARCPLP